MKNGLNKGKMSKVHLDRKLTNQMLILAPFRRVPKAEQVMLAGYKCWGYW